MRCFGALRAARLGLALVAAAACLAACETSDPAAPEPGLPPGWLAGRVRDDAGAPLAGVRVLSGEGGPQAVTGPDGTFRLGPFAEGDTVTLTTDSPDTVSGPGADDAWYDFTTAPLPVDNAGTVTITLLTRYAIELEGSASWVPSNDHFSHFLEYSTNPLGSASGASISWSWPSWPLAVHVRDSTITHAGAEGDVSIDAGACVRAGMERWNEAAGFPLLVETTDPAGAQVVTAYPELGRTKPAEAAPIDPDGCGFRTCPPTRIEIRLSSVHIPDEARFTSIAAHELGHAVGFWGHISTSQQLVENGVPVPALMESGGGSAGNPIHELEVKAIIAKFHIPPGTALEQYEGTAPWYADFPPPAAAPVPGP